VTVLTNLQDVAFCTLGTTRKDAGSAAAFREVDLHLVMRFAKQCKEANIRDFHLLTSQGANPKSWFLYPQTKGEVEEGVKGTSPRPIALPFRSQVWRFRAPPSTARAFSAGRRHRGNECECSAVFEPAALCLNPMLQWRGYSPLTGGSPHGLWRKLEVCFSR